MRRLRLAVLTGLLLASGVVMARSPFYQDRIKNGVKAVASGVRTKFYLPPNAGWPVASWGGGVAEPTYQWYGSDPTGALGQSWAGTVTGTIEDVASPVCANGTCWTGKSFDGVNDEVTATSKTIGVPGTGDFSACVAFANRTAGIDFVFGHAVGTGTGSWSIFTTLAQCKITITDGDAGHAISANAGGTGTGAGSGYDLCCLSRDYDGNYVAWANGTAGATRANTTLGISPNYGMTVGGLGGVAGNRVASDIVWAGYWAGVAYGDASFDVLYARVFGLHPSTGASDVAFARTTVGCGEDSAGQRQCFGAGVPVLANADSISVCSAGTNYALNSLNWAAHTDVGTPTDCMAAVPTNCNSTSGPSSVYYGGAEADTIGDDDGAAYEGGRIVAETTYTGEYTADAYVKPGTETGATILITSDGTGSKTCTYTGLDNLATATSVGGSILCLKGAACTGSNSYPTGFARLVCSTTIGGVPSATTADLLVGDAAADTGTIIASAGEAWRLAYPGRACPTAGVAATCNASSLGVATTGWPTNKGCVSVDYTPEVANGFTTDRVLVEARAASAGWSLAINATDGALEFYSESTAGAGDTATTAALTWTAGTTYPGVKACWTGAAVTFYRAGSSVGTDTLTDVADAIDATGYIGSLAGSSLHALGQLKGLRVQR